MIIKECRVCGAVKEHTIKRSTGKAQTMCRECKSVYNGLYYEQTKERHNPTRTERRVFVRNLIRDFLRWCKDAPCADCEVRYHYCVMQFDHVRGEKSFDLASALAKSFLSVIEELGKCEVVCANCHAMRTFTKNRNP